MRSNSLIFVALAGSWLAQGQTAPQRPAIVGVAHIGLYSGDLAKSEEFYGHVLGYAHFSTEQRTDYKVNEHQYIEVYPRAQTPTESRLSDIAFETKDARKLRNYLAAKGVNVPATVERDSDKNYSFAIKDPDGHAVEFVEYARNGVQASQLGKLLPSTRVSDHIIHVGFTVSDRAAEDRLFKDILGFRLMWYGGMNDTETRWVDMRVPEGTDWLEYMLGVKNPTPKTLGVMNHLALGVKSIQPAYQTVVSRSYKAEQPKIGRDGKWQLNLYDPDLTRAELMEFKPVQRPCCSPMILPTP